MAFRGVDIITIFARRDYHCQMVILDCSSAMTLIYALKSIF
jgi:hypothetical protein